MSPQNLFAILVFVILLMVWYSANSKRSKILCRYTGRDKTEEEKWVDVGKGYVIFRGRKFDIITRRIKNFWFTKGVHMILPTKISLLEYSWYSRFPHDPDNYSNVWESPEVRNLLNKEEDMRALGKGIGTQMGKKQSGLTAYLPIIAIILVVLVAFYFYTQMQAQGQHLKALENMIKAMK